MRRLLFMIMMMTATAAASAQIFWPMVVVDRKSIKEGVTKNARIAAQIEALKEAAKKLDTSLDFMRKVSSAVRNAATVKELAECNVRLTRDCASLLKEADALNPELATSVSRCAESILANNASILALSTQVLSTSFRMNDNARLKTLMLLDEEMRVQQRNLALCRHHVETGRDIRRMYDRLRGR